MERSRTALLICLIVIITFLSYYPSLENGFTNWDDYDYVTCNSLIRDISWQSLYNIFEFTDENRIVTYFTVKFNYTPLTILSFALDYHFFKLAPAPYHMVNLLFHIANSVLVFFLILLLTESEIPSFFTALLFAIHPLHVESVAWISERKDVLYSFFYLLSLLCYIKYVLRGNNVLYGSSIVLFLLSLLSKPMAASLPLLLPVIDYLLKRKLRMGTVVEKLPFFALSAMCFHITSTIVQLHKNTDLAPTSFHMPDMLYTPCYRILFYIGKMIAPFNLSSYYSSADGLRENMHSVIFLTAPLLIAIIAAAVIYSTRFTRKIAFGTSFFLITILPAVIITPGYLGIKADRYTYIPLIGLFYLISDWLYGIYCRDRRHSSLIRRALLCLAVLLIGGQCIMTYQRCAIWKDSISLWSDVLRHNPRTDLAYVNRGQAFFETGNVNMALKDMSEAIRINPGYTEAYNNRGSIFFSIKDYDRASADYDSALKLDPESAKAYYNKALICSAIKDDDHALENLNRAIELDRRYTAAYLARGNLRGIRKDYQGALDDLNQVILMEPGNSEALFSRALTHYHRGDYLKAMDDVKRLQRMGQPPDPAFIRDLELHLMKPGSSRKEPD